MITIYNFENQRLGNHLFMIANAYSFSLENKKDLRLPNWKYKDFFKNYNIKNLDNNKNFFIYDEDLKGFNYNKIKIDENQKNICLKGYFQSEKYFINYENEIRNFFQFSIEIEEKIEKKYKYLIDLENTCSVHIRRGDYLNLQEYHPVQPLSYYLKAMKKIGKNKFVFFSDDINWCKEFFTHEDFVFIEGQSDIEDLILMSKMKNNIIANSSFSWWSAWLNKNLNKKIIAPNLWFGKKYINLDTKDLIPDNWLKI